jgi:hypothetical protein
MRAVVFATIVIASSEVSFHRRSRQPALVPGGDTGHHTRGRVCYPLVTRDEFGLMLPEQSFSGTHRLLFFVEV